MDNTYQLHLQPEDNLRLANLCGHCNEHLQQIETYFQVSINNRGYDFYIKGTPEKTKAAAKALMRLYEEAKNNPHLMPTNVHLVLRTSEDFPEKSDIVLKTKFHDVKPRTSNQQRYVERILHHDINFGIGPAGTGKTYLAVACAVQALEQNKVKRILLVRPAIEAGEKLGFLPGDLAQKVDPYLRPLYDALFEMLGFEYVEKLLERNVIEIAPLAFMRGRTFSDAFVILDESQNTTIEQMKMFLTRIGYGSKAVINGDLTQIDLPKHVYSGLQQAIDILSDIKEISFTHFVAKDIIRHPLVQKIVEAYEEKTKK
jgi:phosphate starvation-inducible PhoH-like protein